jgi:hypothetical protein
MFLDCIVAASPCSQHVAAQVIRFRVLEKSFGDFGTPIFCGGTQLEGHLCTISHPGSITKLGSLQ